MSKDDDLKWIEEQGYKAAIAGEAISNYGYGKDEKGAAFHRGYYRGIVWLNRKREEQKESRRCEKDMTDGQSKTGGMDREA